MLGKKWTEQQSSSANSLSVSVSVPTPDSVLPEQEGDVLDSFNEDDASLAVPRTARVNFDEGVGIIPRCITDIYDVLNEKVSKGLIEFSIRKYYFFVLLRHYSINNSWYEIYLLFD